MKAYLNYLNEIANKVTLDHSKYQEELKWVNPYGAYDFEDEKNRIVQNVGTQLNWAFKNTKPWINSISRGCQLCGKGEWSCLFITGICNANCFYCPARQDQDDLPQTQKLLFKEPEAYADYINEFGFRGVAFSGGEPLMAFERTLEFVKAIRSNCDPNIYVWMYTNGILGSESKFKLLADAGIDEIRFDLGATNYNPKVLKEAARFIENVTVEIPAVPEEVELLKSLLPKLCEYGVTNLNLHQLRLTAYNAQKLLARNYTYLHGEQPTVLESELAAFEIIDFVAEQKLPIGVNYCNFQFKNRFQKAGFRLKMAKKLVNHDEEITENGYLRTIIAQNDNTVRSIKFDEFVKSSETVETINLNYRGRVIENLKLDGAENNYIINDIKYPVQDGLAIEPLHLDQSLFQEFIEMIHASGKLIPENPTLFKAWQYEFIEEDMRPYF